MVGSGDEVRHPTVRHVKHVELPTARTRAKIDVTTLGVEPARILVKLETLVRLRELFKLTLVPDQDISFARSDS